MNVKWRLRMAAAQREVWTGAELRRLLAERAGLEMSAASVSALLTKQPRPAEVADPGGPVHRARLHAERPARGGHDAGRGQSPARQASQTRQRWSRGRSMPPL